MSLRKLWAAVLFGLGIVAIGPLMGALVPQLSRILSDGYVRWLSVGFGGVLAVLMLGALWRIRERRLARYGLLLLALGLAALRIFVFSRNSPTEGAVERAHFLFYGVLAYLLYRAFRSAADPSALALPLLGVALVGTLDEWLQWLVPLRVGEGADVVLNVEAGLCGLIVAVAVDPLGPFHWRMSLASIRRLCWLGALVLVIFGGFAQSAHLGYRYFDPEIGWFESWFRIDRLEAEDKQRAARWARRPPGRFRALEVEDYYRTEAGWRVSHRNASLQRGDLYQADKENQILETYYGAFLDLPGDSRRYRFRLPPEQTESLVRNRPPVDPYVYRSPADLGRSYPRPLESSWWTAISLLAGILLLLPVIVQAVAPAGETTAARER